MTAELNAGDTVYVRGSSGTIDKIDVPANVHTRERFDLALERDEISIVDANSVEEYTGPSGGTLFRLKDGAEPPKAKAAKESPAPADGAGDSGAPAAASAPAKSAGVGAWREFAIAQGMDADEAAATDKKALIAKFGT